MSLLQAEPIAWPMPGKARRDWLEIGAVVAVVLLAALLRFWRLGELPRGIDLDEARNGLEALGVLNGRHPLFFTTFDPREPAFIYSLSLAVAALGPTMLAMRLTAAVWGLLGVALTYPLARQWFGRNVALLATAGMAVSLWTLAMTRWAERDLTLLPPLLLFLLFFWRGFERRSVGSFALAGMFASLCAYAYVAARILPLLILAILAAQWLLDRESVSANRRGLLAGLLAGAATIAPLAAYFAGNPSAFFGRIGQISSLGQPLPGVTAESLPQTMLNTLGMFFVHGDVNWRDGIAGRPVFSWWVAIPFCMGLSWALVRILRSAKDVRAELGEVVSQEGAALRLYPCVWLLLWQGTLLVPAFLARPSPQYDRTIGTAPSSCILLALGLAVSAAWLARARPWMGTAAWLGSVGVMALLTVDTWQAYFGSWAHADPPLRVFEYGQTFDADALNRLQPPPDHTYLFLGYDSGSAVRYLAPRYAGSVWLEDFSQLLPVPRSGSATYVFASPSLGGTIDSATVRRYVPDAKVLAQDVFAAGGQAAAIFEASEDQLQALRGAARIVNAPFGDRLMLHSIDLADRELAVQPGAAVRLTLDWTVLAPIQDNIGPFVHVLDAAGRTVAQDDRQGMATGGWQPGQELLSLLTFRLPEDASAGAYRVMAGVARRSDSQPSQSLAELGAQVPVLLLDVTP